MIDEGIDRIFGFWTHRGMPLCVEPRPWPGGREAEPEAATYDL